MQRILHASILLVKKLFHIGDHSDKNTQPVLVLRIGNKYCGFSITDHSTGELKQLAYYTTGETDEQSLQELFRLHSELGGSFYRVLVCFDYPECSLVPLKFYDHERVSDYIKPLFDINGGSAIVSESIPGWQLYNVYAVPEKIYDLVRRKFITAKYWHNCSVAMQKSTVPGNKPTIIADFRIDEFSLLLFNNNVILLSQTFPYAVPADVVYYLLNILSQLNLFAAETELYVSGLIDKDSSLAKELSQYFSHTEFREAGWKLQPSELPSHFFTSFNDITLCAS